MSTDPKAQNIEQQQPARRSVLEHLKRRGASTIRELAAALSVTGEAVRQQLAVLRAEGWVELARRPRASSGAGRPAVAYALTVAGDHLFPKHYDDLSLALIEAVSTVLGPDATRVVLAAVVEARVRAWRPKLEGLPLRERLEALRGLYVEGDPFARVDATPDGYRLVERNCPFLNVAMARPALCSVTVNTLSRLLGRRVVREQRFQEGHGQCVFRVLRQEVAADRSFSFEDEHRD